MNKHPEGTEPPSPKEVSKCPQCGESLVLQSEIRRGLCCVCNKEKIMEQYKHKDVA